MRLRFLKTKGGYTLVLVVLILALISVIGIGLMGLTSSGVQKNVVREDITQASQQAEKGLDHISLQIQQELKNVIKNLDPRDAEYKTKYQAQFTNLLSPYLCSDTGGSNLITKGDSQFNYSTCLDSIPVTEDTLKELSFTSKGTADGEQKILHETMKIGAILYEYPEILNYAVSTHDGGDLILTGGVEIKGDVKTGGNIVVSKRSYIPYTAEWKIADEGATPWEASVYPAITGPSVFASTTAEAKLFINKDKHLYEMYNERLLGGSCNWDDVSTQGTKDVSFLGYLTDKDLRNYNFDEQVHDCIFHTYPITKVQDYLFSNHKPDLEDNFSTKTMDIASIVSDAKQKLKSVVIKNQYTPNPNDKLKTPKLIYSSYNATTPTWADFSDAVNESPIITGDYLVTKNTILDLETFNFNGNFYYKGAHISLYNGQNTLRGNWVIENDNEIDPSIKLDGGKHTLDGQFYVYSGTGQDQAIHTFTGEHTFKGSYYLDGDLSIKESTIHADAVFYVNGNVTIEDSSLDGIKYEDGHTGYPIIFATGDIFYKEAYKTGSNFGKEYYNETPTVINTFLYTNGSYPNSTGTIELNGAVSNLKVIGGIAGKNVLLNGLRGHIKQVTAGFYEFPTVEQQTNADARLVIEYSPDIVTTYSNQNVYTTYHELVQQPIQTISRKIE